MKSQALAQAQSLSQTVRQYRRQATPLSNAPKPGEARYRKMKSIDRMTLARILAENERIYNGVD